MGALTCRGALLSLLLAAACSPEARRVRDGGPGADPRNVDLVESHGPDPHAADTTLWPGRAPSPVERLARGLVPPPTFPRPQAAPAQQGNTPVKPNVPPSEAQQRTFNRGQSANPERQSH